ncbi:hypothetical protein PIB30_100398, partial [Stylosanthes scabra]|nr:hypothetical protein [Stylosanthes scabra]
KTSKDAHASAVNKNPSPAIERNATDGLLQKLDVARKRNYTVQSTAKVFKFCTIHRKPWAGKQRSGYIGNDSRKTRRVSIA